MNSELTIYSSGKAQGERNRAKGIQGEIEGEREGSREMGVVSPRSTLLFAADINAKDVERKGYEDWLHKIHQFFQSDQVLSGCYEFHAVTETSLEFTLDHVEVELVVSPHWGNPASFYTFLDSIREQHRSK